jgi:hypothetical protein
MALPSRATPEPLVESRRDGNNDGLCNVSYIVAANVEISSPGVPQPARGRRFRGHGEVSPSAHRREEDLQDGLGASHSATTPADRIRYVVAVPTGPLRLVRRSNKVVQAKACGRSGSSGGQRTAASGPVIPARSTPLVTNGKSPSRQTSGMRSAGPHWLRWDSCRGHRPTGRRRHLRRRCKHRRCRDQVTEVH